MTDKSRTDTPSASPLESDPVVWGDDMPANPSNSTSGDVSGSEMNSTVEDSSVSVAGNAVGQENTATNEDDNDSTPDLENRILCIDGACIGIIGSDGCCKVCGLKYDPAEATQQDTNQSANGFLSSISETEFDTEDDRTAFPDLSHRQLCSDGSCIGVIGPDGRCKVCGKPYTGESDL